MIFVPSREGVLRTVRLSFGESFFFCQKDFRFFLKIQILYLFAKKRHGILTKKAGLVLTSYYGHDII